MGSNSSVMEFSIPEASTLDREKIYISSQVLVIIVFMVAFILLFLLILIVLQCCYLQNIKKIIKRHVNQSQINGNIYSISTTESVNFMDGKHVPLQDILGQNGKQPGLATSFHTSLVNEMSKSKTNRFLSAILCTTVDADNDLMTHFELPEIGQAKRPSTSTKRSRRHKRNHRAANDPTYDVPLYTIRSPSGHRVQHTFGAKVGSEMFHADSKASLAMAVPVPTAPFREAGVDVGTQKIPVKSPLVGSRPTARHINFQKTSPVAISAENLVQRSTNSTENPSTDNNLDGSGGAVHDISEPKTPNNVLYIRDFINETTESIDPKVTTGNTTRDPCQVPPNSQIGMLSGIQKLTLNSTSEPALQHLQVPKDTFRNSVSSDGINEAKDLDVQPTDLQHSYITPLHGMPLGSYGHIRSYRSLAERVSSPLFGRHLQVPRSERCMSDTKQSRGRSPLKIHQQTKQLYRYDPLGGRNFEHIKPGVIIRRNPSSCSSYVLSSKGLVIENRVSRNQSSVGTVQRVFQRQHVQSGGSSVKEYVLPGVAFPVNEQQESGSERRDSQLPPAVSVPKNIDPCEYWI